MGIRNINKIYEENDIIIEIVKESKLMYENEKDAYNLLNKHAPQMISFDDKKSSIVLEKINGKRLSKIKIDEKIVIKLAKAIKYLHSYTKNGKYFVHGDLHNDNIDNSSIVIGDSYTDYLFAKNCNLKFICMYNRIEDCNSYKDFNEVDKLIKENI